MKLLTGVVIASAVLLAACSSAPATPAESASAAKASGDAAHAVKPTKAGASKSAAAKPSPSPSAAPKPTGPAVSVKHVTVHGRDVSLLYVNQDKAKFRFVPGTESPGGFNATKDAPKTYRNQMLAAFNGGFLPQHTQGGYYFRGRSYSDLVDNRASLVIGKDGTLDVIKWNGQDPSEYAVVRQNLRMLINDGVDKTIDLNGCDDWGPLGTGPSAHRRCPGERSAVGITEDGTVIYAFGFEVMAGDLASALLKAGAVRAMPLEINNWWPSAFTYKDGEGKRVDPQVRDEPTRYSGSTPWKRDFVVVLPR